MFLELEKSPYPNKYIVVVAVNVNNPQQFKVHALEFLIFIPTASVVASKDVDVLKHNLYCCSPDSVELVLGNLALPRIKYVPAVSDLDVIFPTVEDDNVAVLPDVFVVVKMLSKVEIFTQEILLL